VTLDQLTWDRRDGYDTYEYFRCLELGEANISALIIRRSRHGQVLVCWKVSALISTRRESTDGLIDDDTQTCWLDLLFQVKTLCFKTMAQ